MLTKIKSLFSDKENRKKILNLIYSIGATAIFNMVLQFLVYPTFERRLGSESYGVALSAISLLAIVAGTCGYSVNCSRLLGVKENRTSNGDYNFILLIMGVISSIIGVLYLVFIGLATPVSACIFVALVFATMLRYYSEVEFRLSTNFFRYMIYYVLISVGYVVGLLIFRVTDSWMTALLIGEVLGVLFVIVFGTIYKKPFSRPTKQLGVIVTSIGFIFVSALIDNVTLHADRILLLAITGDGSTVTTYYIASLVGKIVSMLTLPINAILLSYLVRYGGALSKKLWAIAIGAASVFGLLGFVGCMIVSPILIKILYPDNLSEVLPYVAPAILGQIFYFVSGMLMIVLLHFKGEKKQFIFNFAYAVEFFTCVAIGTAIGGLEGFVWSILIANAIRFVAAIIWGFATKKSAEKEISDKAS